MRARSESEVQKSFTIEFAKNWLFLGRASVVNRVLTLYFVNYLEQFSFVNVSFYFLLSQLVYLSPTHTLSCVWQLTDCRCTNVGTAKRYKWVILESFSFEQGFTRSFTLILASYFSSFSTNAVEMHFLRLSRFRLTHIYTWIYSESSFSMTFTSEHDRRTSGFGLVRNKCLSLSLLLPFVHTLFCFVRLKSLQLMRKRHHTLFTQTFTVKHESPFHNLQLAIYIHSLSENCCSYICVWPLSLRLLSSFGFLAFLYSKRTLSLTHVTAMLRRRKTLFQASF